MRHSGHALYPSTPLPIWDIIPAPRSWRSGLDNSGLAELSASVREHGLQHPILVRPLKDGRYQLISGARRLRACRIAGFTSIDCSILDIDEREGAMLSMVENLHRGDTHFLDEALCYAWMMDRYQLSQTDLARHLGRSPAFVSNKLRLLRLSQSVRGAILQASLSEQHAMALLHLYREEEQLHSIREIVKRGLNAAQTEQLIARIIEQREHQPVMRRSLRAWGDWRMFRNTLQAMIHQLRSAGVPVRYTIRDAGKQVEMRIVMPRVIPASHRRHASIERSWHNAV